MTTADSIRPALQQAFSTSDLVIEDVTVTDVDKPNPNVNLNNNAGIDLTGPVESREMKGWRRIMDINVDGVFLGVKTLVPLMAESGKDFRGGSSIINVSSIMGLVGYNEVSAYNASKGAVRMFTKGIAIEFAQKQMPIRANSLHPGFVVTPLLHAGFKRWVDKGFAEKTDDLIDAVSGQTPLGRLADPAELAAWTAVANVLLNLDETLMKR